MSEVSCISATFFALIIITVDASTKQEFSKLMAYIVYTLFIKDKA